MVSQSFVDGRRSRVQDYDTPAQNIEIRDGRKIPLVSGVKYNEIVRMDLSMVSIDIKGYTKLVTDHPDEKVLARIMKIYVTEMAAAIREHGGTIVSIEGDGILGAFHKSDNEKDNPQQNAVRCVTTMSTLLKHVVNKTLRSFKQDPLNCRYGVDFGRVNIIRAGIRGEGKNDLVFIGKTTSTAVKIQNEAKVGYMYVSKNVYSALDDHFADSETWKWTTVNSRRFGQLYSKKTNGWSGIT